MSGFDVLRSAIVATLQGVEGIGQVHNYERFAKSEKDFKTLYATAEANEQRILGWHVRRVGFRQSQFNGRVQYVTKWRIAGFMSLQDVDATELMFDQLIDKITEAFNGQLWQLNNFSSEDENGIQLDEAVPVMFAGVLCHSARLSLTTVHNQ